ncbi:restriction endonuclease [Algibacter sp. TI.3.09]|uniref:restriction endonuclease n=1 Tax=Algibacter sp. TI.3.09 TaxID=3121298 RepID=UPI00311D6308
MKFDQITPRAFENLCYDLLVTYNFHNLIWREGGADNGRDIEGNYFFRNTIKNLETKWFFECKRYSSGGVLPADISSKITWADAEQPDYLVFFISSYLTNNARTWLEKIEPQKQYEIVIIEGEDLKNRLLKYPELIERYFSLNRYEQLFNDVRDYKTKFNINPSFEFLKEISENIDLAKLDKNEIGFILFNFYNQFNLFENRNEYYGDFDETIIYPVLEHLKNSVDNTSLKSFEAYKDDYDILGGTGMFEEMFWLNDEDNIHEIVKYNFQHYDLHLNHKQAKEKWKIGSYLFVIYEDLAFEIFDSEETEIRIIKDFTPEKISELTNNTQDEIVNEYKKYLKNFSA